MISFKVKSLAVSLTLATIIVVGLAQRLIEESPSLEDSDLYQLLGTQQQGQDADWKPAHRQQAYYGYVQRTPQPREEYAGRVALREDLQEDDMINVLADELLEAAHGRQQPQNEAGELQKKDTSPIRTEPLFELNDPINSHWPATGIDDEQSAASYEEGAHLSRPVNDPEEFEAKMGQLTDELNHSMPNSLGRQKLLMGLINRTSGLVDLSSADKDQNDRLIDELMKWAVADQSNIGQQQQQQLSPYLVNKLRSDQGGDIGENSHSATTEDGDEEGDETSTRYTGSEYIDHPLSLASQHYVQGGAGEGRQLLGPDGTFENVQVIKTDSGIPSYCDPPNPCPIGYTAKDGCLEKFVNLASFSREYQAKQKCSCDNEHSLFNCAAPSTAADVSSSGQLKSLESQDVPESSSDDGDSEETRDKDNDETSTSLSSSPPPFASATDKLDTLARAIQNRFGDLASVQKLIGEQHEQQQHLGDEGLSLAGNDDEHSDYLVRSARKLSSLDMHHKVNLD